MNAGRGRVGLYLGIAGTALLSACAGGGGGHGQGATLGYYESHAAHDYTPPGPPSDPWGPYIQQASAKFDVPQMWIRQVMRVESGGHEYIDGHLTVSAAGAMGLLQLEPSTYQEMASRYGLGDDPFNPYDNIMAGTAYIHEMYEIYGSPGFLAAYNAGPGRLDSYMTDGTALPDETVNYVAMIAPNIQGYYPANRSPADQLALNTQPMGSTDGGILPPGFAPNAPAPADADIQVAQAGPAPVTGLAPPPAPVQVADRTPVQNMAPAASAMSSIAPGQAVAAQSLPPPVAPPIAPPIHAPAQTLLASAAPMPEALPSPPPAAPVQHFTLVASADAAPVPQPVLYRASVHSGWAIQVGAYSSSSNAKAALGIAELSAVAVLVNAHPMVISVYSEGHMKYRARFVGLEHDDAVSACGRLATGPTGCVVLSPDAQSS